MRFLGIIILLSIYFGGFGQLKNSEAERIAILDFEILGNPDYMTEYSWMSTGFSESLTDAFSRVKKFSVIERSQLKRILEEQNLQGTNKIDTGSVVQVGKILGVRKVLLGSCQIVTGHLLVNMRMVNVETGEISPIDNLPIITPIDSVLYMQKTICLEILRQFRVKTDTQDEKEIIKITSNSTKNVIAYGYLVRGIDFFNNGQYEEALQMYDVALNYDRNYGKAYYKRGITNYAMNLYGKAALDFDRSDNYLNKDTIYVLMSNAFMKQGNFKKSYEYLKKAQKISPENITVTRLLRDFPAYQLKPVKSLAEPGSAGKIDMVYDFNYGIAKVRSGNRYGFIDTANKIVLPILYSEIRDHKYGFAAIRLGSKWGFVNDFGKVVVEPQFASVGDFNGLGVTEVQVRQKWGAINSKGQVVIPIEFDMFRVVDSLIVVSRAKGLLGNTYMYGVYDLNGRQILPLIYSEIERHYSFVDGYYPYIHVALDGKWGVVNRKNEIIVPFKYDSEQSLRKFSNGYAAVRVGAKWGFIDSRGKEIIAPQYDNVQDHRTDYFVVKRRGKWGIVDSNNVVKVPIEYDDLEYLGSKYWGAKKGIKWGIVTSENQLQCGFIYDALGMELSHRGRTVSVVRSSGSIFTVQVTKDGKSFWINQNCTCVFDCN